MTEVRATDIGMSPALHRHDNQDPGSPDLASIRDDLHAHKTDHDLTKDPRCRLAGFICPCPCFLPKDWESRRYLA